MEKQNDVRTDGMYTLRLSDVIADCDLVREIAACYREIFNAKGDGEWGESWTQEDAEKKFFESPVAVLATSHISFWRKNGKVVGLSLVHTNRPEFSLCPEDLPPNLRTGEHVAGILKNIEWIVGGNPMLCHFKEVGILKEARGGIIPVIELFRRAWVAAQNDGADYAYWWTSRKSKVLDLVRGLDAEFLYDFRDTYQQVVLGGEPRHAIRRLSCPPAEIAAMIAERLRQKGQII